jgi:hypothetical protein
MYSKLDGLLDTMIGEGNESGVSRILMKRCSYSRRVRKKYSLS